MALVLTSAPAVEPISVAEAKTHMRVDDATEDVLISSLILTSRLHIEAGLGLALITQTWKLVLDRWPKTAAVPLPLRPVQSVSSATVLAADGTLSVLSPDDYVLEGQGLPPRLVRTGNPWPVPGRPAAGIEIVFTAGFGPAASDVPEPIRQALLLLVTHWYDHRAPIEIGGADTAIPRAVSELLVSYRVPRL